MQTEEKITKNKILDKIKVTDGKGVVIDYTEVIMTEKYDVESKQIVSEDKNFIKHSITGDYLPHKDLMDALKMLRKPLLDICDIKDHKNFDRYRIYGITLFGEQEEANVIVMGAKEVEWSGKVFNLVTPATPLYDNEKFSGSKQLDGFCKAISDEAFAYLEGKHAENPQLSLQFENGENLNMAVEK